MISYQHVNVILKMYKYLFMSIDIVYSIYNKVLHIVKNH